jgi:hypothetical protein
VGERIAIICEGFGRSRGGGWPVGAYLASYDPEANDGQGDAVWTDDPARALLFESTAEAYELYRAVPRNRPLRADGKPNRPLTALSVEMVGVRARVSARAGSRVLEEVRALRTPA